MFIVVTDSTAYLTREEAVRLGVRVLPMSYSSGGMPLGEGFLEENGNFEALLARKPRAMHTSQVSMSAFLSAFNEALRKGHEVLCLTISSRLSGTYGNALIAARELQTERVTVVDSLTTAAGLRFLVEKASALSREGASPLEAAGILEGMRDAIGTALSVDDMEALRRSGRLGFVRQSVGTILNIRPILLVKDGAVVAAGTARGSTGQIKELVQAIPRDARRVEVQYIVDRTAVQALDRAVRSAFACPVHKRRVGPVLAIHLGLSAMGVSWQRG